MLADPNCYVKPKFNILFETCLFMVCLKKCILYVCPVDEISSVG